MNVYVLFAQVRQGVEQDFLAVYSTLALAQEFIDAQDEQLRQCLVIWEVEIDKYPSDPYWKKPEGLAGAFHALAGLPGDALPDDRVTDVADAPKNVQLGSLTTSIAPEAVGMTDDEAEAFSAPRHGADAGGPATLDDIRQLALEVGDSAKVDTWLDHPLDWADGRTPRQLAAEGRGDAVLKYLRQSESGSSG